MKRTILLLSVLSAISMNAQYDGFEYTGAINGNGWDTFNGAGTNIVTSTPGLTYPGIEVKGGKVSLVKSGVSGVSANESATFPFTNLVTTTAYASFLLNVTDVSTATANSSSSSVTGYFFSFSKETGANTNVNTGKVCRVGIRKGSTDNTFNLGILNTSGTVTQIYGSNPADYNVGQTYLVVIKYDTSNNTSTFWVNPVISGTEDANPIASSNAGTSPITEVASVAIRQRSNSFPAVDLDEIRIGTTWAEVMPATLATSEVKTASAKNLISNTLVKDSFRVLDNVSLEIYSTNGTLVKSASYKQNQEVNVQNLASGVYFVRVVSGNASSVVKIVKQ